MHPTNDIRKSSCKLGSVNAIAHGSRERIMGTVISVSHFKNPKFFEPIVACGLYKCDGKVGGVWEVFDVYPHASNPSVPFRR